MKQTDETFACILNTAGNVCLNRCSLCKSVMLRESCPHPERSLVKALDAIAGEVSDAGLVRFTVDGQYDARRHSECYGDDRHVDDSNQQVLHGIKQRRNQNLVHQGRYHHQQHYLDQDE